MTRIDLTSSQVSSQMPLPKGGRSQLRLLHRFIEQAKRILREAGEITVSLPDTIVYPALPLPHFVPSEIGDWLLRQPHLQTVYDVSYTRKKRKKKVLRFVMPCKDSKAARNAVELMSIWSIVCDLNNPSLNIPGVTTLIYPHSAGKFLPETPTTAPGPEHANSGYCSLGHKGVPSEIVIFREEEWFKVFIHESIHAWALDGGLDMSLSLQAQLAEVFPQISSPSIQEAYTEAWARIGLCAMLSNRKGLSALEWVDDCQKRLAVEQAHGMRQIQGVLGSMGLTLSDTTGKQGGLYKECTHVFSYYILASLFVLSYPAFLTWCSRSGPTLMLPPPLRASRGGGTLGQLVPSVLLPSLEEAMVLLPRYKRSTDDSMRMTAHSVELNCIASART